MLAELLCNCSTFYMVVESFIFLCIFVFLAHCHGASIN